MIPGPPKWGLKENCHAQVEISSDRCRWIAHSGTCHQSSAGPRSPDRPIPDRYVCIAAQSTTQAKYWNNPFGWREVISFLKAEGYEVVCIDRAAASGHGLIWNHRITCRMVRGTTGNRPFRSGRVGWGRAACRS